MTDKGEIVGQQVATSALEEVADDLRRIEPPILSKIESMALMGSNAVIALRLQPDRPSLAFSRATVYAILMTWVCGVFVPSRS